MVSFFFFFQTVLQSNINSLSAQSLVTVTTMREIPGSLDVSAELVAKKKKKALATNVTMRVLRGNKNSDLRCIT